MRCQAETSALGVPCLTYRNNTERPITVQLGTNKLVGQQGIVTEELTAHHPGRVKLAGEVWSACPYDETTTIAPGVTVEVFAIRGATAYVHPVGELMP